VLRVLFIGDASSILEGIVAAGHHVVGIATRPPPRRPQPHLKGVLARAKSSSLRWRGALARLVSGAPRILTGDANAPAFVASARALAPDVLLCAGWPQRLQATLLAVPRRAAVNFHMALLPRHRGADPLAWTILRGDAEAGVTFHVMTPRFDDGPILLQSRFAVAREDTRGSLRARALARGVALLPELLARIEADATFSGAAQDESCATEAPRPRADDIRVDFAHDASEVARRIRARGPAPGVALSCGGRRIVVHFASAIAQGPSAPPGTLVSASANLARVSARDGDVLLASSNGVFRSIAPGTRVREEPR
jgi:methionyl-tRNA formyltransferase